MKKCKTEISDTNEQSTEVRRAIASRAFALYEDGGRKQGRDLDDWTEAERQIHSLDTVAQVSEARGALVIRAHIELVPGIDFVVSLSEECLLIFRAAKIDDREDRDLLQIIHLDARIEVGMSEALLDGSDLTVTCSCSQGHGAKRPLSDQNVQLQTV